jgi:hypothetical protein
MTSHELSGRTNDFIIFSYEKFYFRVIIMSKVISKFH